MIILKKHFNDKDTTIVMLNGIVLIANGCQIFTADHLGIICYKYSVTNEQKQQVIDAINTVSEEIDLKTLISHDSRYIDYLSDDQLQQFIDKNDFWLLLEAIPESKKVTSNQLQQIIDKNDDCYVLRAIARSGNITHELLQQIIEKNDKCIVLDAVKTAQEHLYLKYSR